MKVTGRVVRTFIQQIILLYVFLISSMNQDPVPGAESPVPWELTVQQESHTMVIGWDLGGVCTGRHSSLGWRVGTPTQGCYGFRGCDVLVGI